jgi:hypothetical protein
VNNLLHVRYLSRWVLLRDGSCQRFLVLLLDIRRGRLGVEIHSRQRNHRDGRSIARRGRLRLTKPFLGLARGLGLARSRSRHAWHTTRGAKKAHHSHTAAHLRHSLAKLHPTSGFGVHLLFLLCSLLDFSSLFGLWFNGMGRHLAWTLIFIILAG